MNCAKEIGSDSIDLESFFSSERERMQWQSEGLASDKLSIENAVMILKVILISRYTRIFYHIQIWKYEFYKKN